MKSTGKENYLKTIYELTALRGAGLHSHELADALNVSRPAITDMLKKLIKEGLVEKKVKDGLRLTEKGERSAVTMLRKHRLWETFLIKVLNLSWEEVHDEAEHLEHSASDYLINKIDEYLGFPKFDPHGSPIPQKNGKIFRSKDLIKLTDAVIGGIYIIAEVSDKSRELLDLLNKMGLSLNSSIEIKSKVGFDGSMIIGFNGKEIMLTSKIQESILALKK
jgi:DtxR family Mn-dependent transcriptional regulator